MYQPISSVDLQVIVEAQLRDCTASQRAAFSTYRVPFYEVPLYRSNQIERALVVAHLPSGLLYFEDVEEGFEVGVLDEDNVLPNQGCNQFELRHVLAQAGF